MAKCITEDFALTVPADWQDRSMITWVAPHDGKRQVAPNILCSKDQLKQGEDLDAFVNRQLKELMTKVKNFDLEKRENADFGGKPAVVLEFSMNPQGVPLKQRQVFFLSHSNTRIVNTVVATAAKTDFPALEKSFKSIFESVSWTT